VKYTNGNDLNITRLPIVSHSYRLTATKVGEEEVTDNSFSLAFFSTSWLTLFDLFCFVLLCFVLFCFVL